MSKSLPASKKLMQNYLSELMTEEVVEPSVSPQGESKEKDKLEKLLQKVSVTERHDEKAADAIISQKSAQQTAKPTVVRQSEKPKEVKTTAKHVEVIEPKLETRKSQGEIVLKTEKDYRKASFQAMFFDVAGLVIAVPLVELGGIHNMDTTTSLLGKPPWYKGVMVHREDNINVVDTAQWVMPEKCTNSLVESLNYQYVIMLNNSSWGLMAEHLVDTVTLEPEDVKWLDAPSKRPWLAGLVKERMCALLDVDQLIQLLNDGIDVEQIKS
jgi:purine-binding chemotaxis protein CheW